MAEAAQAKTCPRCQYGLVTCTGALDSPTLSGNCPACGNTVTMPHIVVEQNPLRGPHHVTMGVDDASTLAAARAQNLSKDPGMIVGHPWPGAVVPESPDPQPTGQDSDAGAALRARIAAQEAARGG